MSNLACQNMEIKAKIPISMEKTRQIAAELAGSESKILHQTDTFFNAPLSRLKLRLENGQAELISYSRPDTAGPKLSNFIRTEVVNHDAMLDALKMSLGIKGTVVKKRELFMVERNGLSARIHLDTVEDLGQFIEFEVIITDVLKISDGEDMTKYLINEFGLKDLLSGGYMDKILDEQSAIYV